MDENGNVAQHKAGLVAHEFSPKFETEFKEVFASAVRQVTSNALIAGRAKSMLLKHADVKTAYLNGDLDETVSSTYGKCLSSKQAGHVWNRKFDGVLKQVGFTESANDPCLYNPLSSPKAQNMCCVEQHRSGIRSARQVLPRGTVDRSYTEQFRHERSEAEDNRSIMKQLEYGKVDNRPKHIGTKYNFVRQLCQEGKILDLQFLSTMESRIAFSPIYAHIP